MTFSLCGRAELIRALAQDDPSTTASMTDMLGLYETPRVEREPVASSLVAPPSAPPSHTEPETSEVVDADDDLADELFWRLERFESVSNDTPPVECPARVYVSWRRRPSTTAGFTPLAPKRVVLTRFRQASATRRSTRDIDDKAAVERLSRAGYLYDIPKRQRHVWGSELLIVKDRAWRLTPYWQDQDFVVDVLRRMYPSHGVAVAYLPEGERQPLTRGGRQKVTRLPAAPVLVLSDLGCLANDGEALRPFWLDWGRRLREQGTPAIALVPTHVTAIPPELARVWTLIQWDAAPTAVSGVLLQSHSSAVEHLITLLSPAIRLEPGLVRAVRNVLPEGRGDAGIEARVWQHAAIASPHSVAASWDPAQRKTYQSRFAGQPETDRQAVLDLIQTWRANLHPAIWFEELLGVDEETRRKLIHATDVEDAMAFLTVFSKSVWQGGEASAATKAWAAGLVERLPDGAYGDAEV